MVNATRRIQKQAGRRKFRVRNRVKRDANVRHRLTVFRSNRRIYAQIVDDSIHITICAACSAEDAAGGNVGAASNVGRRIAELALAVGVTRAVFDRGSYKFHGRVAALAEGARAAGLEI